VGPPGLLPAAPATPECILDLLAGLLQVALSLIDPALGLQVTVAGDLAGIPLDPAA
jgi:hypothetical protein